jgi:oligoribonuclease NrnB/cAMP/cGMP phosphodiesterase (DHH superfamily)
MPEIKTPERIDRNNNISLTPDQFVVNITHSADADGHASAMVVKRYFKKVLVIATNHGKAIDYRSIPFNAPVIITDFSLPVDEMRQLMQTNPIIWIDHHQTYLQPEYQEFRNLDGYRNTRWAGCKLTWFHLFGDGAPVPRFIDYVSDYDTWTFEYPESLAFHYGLELYNIQPKYITNVLTNKLFADNEFIDALVNMGRRLIDFSEIKNKILCKYNGFKIKAFHDIPAACMNIRHTNSKAVEPMADEEYKLLLTFGFNQQINLFRVSAYSTDEEKIDCSQLMKELGGGGHKGAAGCAAKYEDLPFKTVQCTPEPPNEDDYIAEINALAMKDPLIFKYIYKDTASLIRLCSWSGAWHGLQAYFVNSPLWDINAMYLTNMVAEFEVVVFFSMSASGWWRYRVYSLEKNHMTQEELLQKVPGGVIKGNAVWYYSKEPPKFPYQEEQQQLQAVAYYNHNYVNYGGSKSYNN